MAKSLVVTPDTVPHPLSDFQVIGHNTYLWTSESYSSDSPLALLFTWMDAAAKHVAKYTVAYQRLFPSARIVLVRCFLSDMFRQEPAYRKLLTPALDVIREHVKGNGEVLVHSFSNGGGTQVLEFAKLWKHTTGELFPIRAQMMDSAPGKGSWKRSHAALSFGFPRTWFYSLLIHIFLAGLFVFDKIMGREQRMLTMCRQLNDPAIFDTRVPRVYLYSEVDVMVGADEVEEHADEAKKLGRHVVKVKFENSPHAGHIREDEKKYWGAVMEAWERGPKEI